MTSPLSSSVVLYVNRDAKKSMFDFIAIQKRDDGKFTINYKGDCTNENVDGMKSTVRIMDHRHDLLDYVEDMMDLLLSDVDTPSFASMDVSIACLPLVSLDPKNAGTKHLLLRSIRSWVKN